MATVKIHASVRSGVPDTLLQQAADLLRDRGIEGMTMRALAEAAGLPAATVQYRFGSKDRLLADAFLCLRDRHAQRLAALALYFESLPDRCPDLADAVLAMLGLGAPEDRLEQLALFDFLAMALRAPKHFPQAVSWAGMLADFWRTMAERSGRGPAKGVFLFELHLGLMLHMSGVAPAVEGQLLAREIVARALRPASERRAPLWFRTILRDTLAAPSFELEEAAPRTTTAKAIVAAAMRMAIDEGPGALSFRTVAARAETSVSAIAHYFATRQDLLYATYRAIHEEIIAFTRSLGVVTESNYDSELAERIVTYSGESRVSLLIAYSEFELVAARNHEFAGLARYFRMTRGPYHTRKQDPDFDPFGDDAFDIFALSFWMVGHSLRMALGQPSGQIVADPEAVAFGFRQFGVG